MESVLRQLIDQGGEEKSSTRASGRVGSGGIHSFKTWNHS